MLVQLNMRVGSLFIKQLKSEKITSLCPLSTSTNPNRLLSHLRILDSCRDDIKGSPVLT